jgi:nitrite reductase/ring-hydroxylating ferredoxin subunit
VGTSRWLLFLIPIIRWTLRRNYNDLMSGDIPMRTRRGQLRKWGYRFQRDHERYGFAETMAIGRDRVILPDGGVQASDKDIDVATSLGKDGDEVLWGRSDHLGLRFRRDRGAILVFPRLCPHEGADLDGSPCANGAVRCPWHGRVFKPLVTIATDGVTQRASTPYHDIELTSGRLCIRGR